ncbi:hypothetical protein ACE02Z_16180 [Shewanella xiamenensis]|uniref:hypothetical protein n=1 Tax=Shewanella xiamenensis TaxID=332186 RepID=UPI00313CCEC5
MWLINWLCSLKHVLICKRRGGCHRRVLHLPYSYCPDCGNVYKNGELMGDDGMTDSERLYRHK